MNIDLEDGTGDDDRKMYDSKWLNKLCANACRADQMNKRQCTNILSTTLKQIEHKKPET